MTSGCTGVRRGGRGDSRRGMTTTSGRTMIDMNAHGRCLPRNVHWGSFGYIGHVRLGACYDASRLHLSSLTSAASCSHHFKPFCRCGRVVVSRVRIRAGISLVYQTPAASVSVVYSFSTSMHLLVQVSSSVSVSPLVDESPVKWCNRCGKPSVWRAYARSKLEIETGRRCVYEPPTRMLLTGMCTSLTM